ncbi:site-specific DNA-methyltransferase [Halogeometricum borinquense]|uniref:Type II methyltransferase n=1 Tax=Halogeometricum borinquense TaxID=60847 RepID=A0A6C0UL02_9EURY|nr:site-specific DNA-methyltransferase [Halogeometricum borinquense]QIB75011.1 site-specific DNA-methyltransferase [Halogeometricum borinquense]QIQ76011.1 site-specific DNA-methyltransferase [Halogeometricum borinquense]
MESRHRVVVGDARTMSEIADDAVELVVTSPPYPMVEMWDDLFSELTDEAGPALRDGDGEAAFEAMHSALDDVWAEISRVLVPGGIACINVGDATRTVGDSFRVYPNHARVTDAFVELGFEPLPDVLWRKPTNSAAKFMGSGMIPPNAYVTLEHEYVLVFRNGTDSRAFDPGETRRYESAYFWEERNAWFSDVWTDVAGTGQEVAARTRAHSGSGDGEIADGGNVYDLDAESGDELRERTAAFPFEIPYRLVNMYSVYGDTVLDPFFGTGTTSLAAMVAGRDSVGYELEDAFVDAFDARATGAPTLSREVVEARLDDHREFVEKRSEKGSPPGYDAENYDFPVVTKQEKELQFRVVSDVQRDGDEWIATHETV